MIGVDLQVMELQSARQVNGSTPQMESTILNLQTRLADKSRVSECTSDMLDKPASVDDIISERLGFCYYVVLLLCCYGGMLLLFMLC